MYCIVNSIDPLDLKEDDNDSDCSDSWELLDYEKEINNEENKSGSGKNEEQARSSLPNKSDKTNDDDTAKAKAAASGKQEKAAHSRKSTSSRKQKVSFEISNLVSKEQKLKQKIELPTTAATNSTTKSSRKQTAELASQQSQLEAGRAQNAKNNNNNDVGDDDSMDSSGFSDCDYGFGGLNDYVMRPKRAQAKRRRNASSSSSSILISMSKRGNERMAAADSSATKKNENRASEVDAQHSKDSKSLKQQDSAASAVKQQSTSSRNIKPKRKKLVLSSSSNAAATTHSDFLKKPAAEKVSVAPQPTMMMKSTTTTGATSESIATEITGPVRVNYSNSNNNNNDTKQQLMPPPAPSSAPLCRTTNNNTSGNDSSDIPDMDESWYLTPPPCFTGAAANKLCIIPKPKAKEAVRENMLIEHPSIYIASTSRQQVTSTTTLPSKKSTKEMLSKQKSIVLKKVSSKQSSSSSASSLSSAGSSGSSKAKGDEKISAPNKAANKVGGEGKKNVKCWDNKFVVANWADDEQADVEDDFDNLFPVLERPSASIVAPNVKRTATKDKSKATANKSGGSKTDNKVKSDSSKKAQPTGFDPNSSSDGHDSDFSILPPPSPLEDEIVVVVECNEASVLSNNVITIDVVLEDENLRERRRNKSSSSEPKVPVKVEPIEPERQPGWQLKKKRALSKRRPLTNLTVVTPSSSKQTATAAKKKSNSRQLLGQSYVGPHGGELSYPGSSSSGSPNWSARSTPTLIDRIGSSIVANLTNLTSGFAHSTGMNMQAPRAPLGEASERMNQMRGGLMLKPDGGSGGLNNLKARKQMSKAFLNRQNISVMAGNSKRRADRRKKMHTTPNGSSVNRKVHTNFH